MAEPLLKADIQADAVKDVVVVGAGPAGSAAAMLLSQKGFRVQVNLRSSAD